jgi:hypothetical protein
LLLEVRQDGCEPQEQKIWRSADDGQHWTDVTPPHVEPFIAGIGSNRVGQAWFTTGECATSGGSIWLSDDFGRVWRRSGGAYVGCHAGSFDDIQFLPGGQIGFETSADPAGPEGGVDRTLDGGRHWHGLSGLKDSGDTGAVLLGIGPTTWTSPTHGFQVAHRYPAGSTYATTTDGRHWHESRPVVVQGYDAAHTTYSLPTFFSPSSGVMEVTVRRSTAVHDLIYRTSDGGAHWRYAAQSPCPVADFGGNAQYSLTLDALDAETWWLMAPYGLAAANQLYETCATSNGGRTWTRSKPPTQRQSSDYLSAANGRTAVVAVSAEIASVYLTTDGRAWQPLPLPS